jgi:hypothetical protein
MAAGDSSYSPCCVDEVEAEHASSDAIVHFGASCLTRFFALHLCDMKSEPDCATETQSCRCIVCLADANSTLLTLPRLSRSVFRTQVLSFSLSLSLSIALFSFSRAVSPLPFCVSVCASLFGSVYVATSHLRQLQRSYSSMTPLWPATTPSSNPQSPHIPASSCRPSSTPGIPRRSRHLPSLSPLISSDETSLFQKPNLLLIKSYGLGTLYLCLSLILSAYAA